MKKNLCIALGIGLAFTLGYGLQGVFRHPEGVPTSGYQTRIIDSIPGKTIQDFFWNKGGIDFKVRYLKEKKSLSPLTLGNLSWYIAEKHGVNPESRGDAILDFISLHNPYETIVLSSAKDIPEFKIEELDPDLRNLSMSRLDVPNPETLAAVATGRLPLSAAQSVTLTVVYTWTRLGGVLKRYRFKTTDGHAPYCYSCIILQSELGDAAYLD